MKNSQNQDNSFSSQDFPSKSDYYSSDGMSKNPKENSQEGVEPKPVTIQKTGKQGFRFGVEKRTNRTVLILQVEEGVMNPNITEDVFFHFRDARPEDFGFTS